MTHPSFIFFFLRCIEQLEIDNDNSGSITLGEFEKWYIKDAQNRGGGDSGEKKSKKKDKKKKEKKKKEKKGGESDDEDENEGGGSGDESS